MGQPVRLHLGCGDKIWKGFINCDLPGNWSGFKPDVECDITKLPFPDSYADEIHAIHVIEHFNRKDVEDILAEWVRVLKPNGKLALECPCLDKIADSLQRFDYGNESWLRATLSGLYGDYWLGHDAMMHKWCYSKGELRFLLEDAGLKQVQALEPLYHQAVRDMRLVGRK